MGSRNNGILDPSKTEARKKIENLNKQTKQNLTSIVIKTDFKKSAMCTALKCH